MNVRSIRLSLVAAILAICGLAFVELSPAAAIHPEPIVPGWNLIGGDGSFVDNYAADHPCVNALYEWDAVNEEWRSYFPNVDPFLNSFGSFRELKVGRGYWVHCKSP